MCRPQAADAQRKNECSVHTTSSSRWRPDAQPCVGRLGRDHSPPSAPNISPSPPPTPTIPPAAARPSRSIPPPPDAAPGTRIAGQHGAASTAVTANTSRFGHRRRMTRRTRRHRRFQPWDLVRSHRIRRSHRPRQPTDPTFADQLRGYIRRARHRRPASCGSQPACPPTRAVRAVARARGKQKAAPSRPTTRVVIATSIWPPYSILHAARAGAITAAIATALPQTPW